MKERPILFSGKMVRAILDGRKTTTRRIVKPQPDRSFTWTAHKQCEAEYKCPYGQAGDRLWVRETWAGLSHNYESDSWEQWEPSYLKESLDFPNQLIYRADGENELIKWTPSIHMLRWASRITLEITNVRVERLQEITEEDAINEGCGIQLLCPDDEYFKAKEHFCILWESINGKKYPWSSNPFVWVISFRRVI